MIGFFPDPYPDELLYSACARFGDRSAYRNIATVPSELFGNQIANIGFPNRLAHLISVLPSGHCYTVDKLIDDHTLLPFYTPFISAQRARVVRKEMAGGQDNRIHARLGINAGRLRLPSKLRFCPDCVVVDRNHHGEAYWHRVHQLPGIEVCPDHTVFLELSTAGWRARENISAFLSAELTVDVREPQRLNLNDQSHLLSLTLAKEARWLLDWRGVPPTKSGLRSRYWNQLLGLGFAYYNGRIKQTELLKQFIKFYSPSLLQRLQCDIGNRNQPWLLKLIRQNRELDIQPPLRHLLLMRFLGRSAQQIFSEFEEYKPFGDGPWPCLNRSASHFQKSTIKTCRITSGQKHNKGLPIGSFACDCGFRYIRVGPDTCEADRLRFERVTAYGPVWEHYLKDRWNDPTVTLTDLGKDLDLIPFTLRRHAIRLGLSFPRQGRWARPTTEKILKKYSKTLETFDCAMESRREHWLTIHKQNPKAARKELISLASYTYYWLSRHDPEWLGKNMPPAKTKRPEPVRVSWETWDQKFPKDIERITTQIKNQKGRPIRVSKEEIIRHLEHRSWLEQRLDKLPETASTLKKCVESREEFLVRRVKWAESSFMQESRCPTVHQFLVQAGTRTITGKARDVQAAIERALQNLQNLT
jgi:hypothetical protein